MASTSRLRLMGASAAVIAGFLSAAACAHAQGQPWRHGIIEPKSDAGFQVMAVRGGFAAKQGLKLELPYFQNDVIALRALLAKAGDPRPEFMFAEAARTDSGIDPKMPIAIAKLEWLQEQLVKAGNLSQPFDVSRVVNGDIRAQALARAGLPH